MASVGILKIISHKPSPLYKIFTSFRYLRNVSRRGSEPKLLKNASVKTETSSPEYIPDIDNYGEFVKHCELYGKMNELEIEEAFTNNDDFGVSYLKAPQLLEDNKQEENHQKKMVKKVIIGKKYFKLDKETNLLTHAAKEQIRYLYQLNPVDWSPDILAENFPISISGVKKLLRNNFILSPKNIQRHDEEVIKRWEALKSGKPTNLISYRTQQLFNEGRIIMKQNYDGNPLLPKPTPISNRIIIDKRKKQVGEFSKIVQNYVQYKDEKELKENDKSENKLTEMQLKEDFIISSVKTKKEKHIVKESSRYHIDDSDRKYSYLHLTTKKQQHASAEDIPLRQFTENLKDEVMNKKSTADSEFVEWVKEGSEQNKTEFVKASCPKKQFEKIHKFKRDVFPSN